MLSRKPQRTKVFRILIDIPIMVNHLGGKNGSKSGLSGNLDSLSDINWLTRDNIQRD